MIHQRSPFRMSAEIRSVIAHRARSLSYRVCRHLLGLPPSWVGFFDPPHRPAGYHSIPLSSPLVPTATLNAISRRARDIATADAEIRNQIPDNCSGSLSCPCNDCGTVRNDLMGALKNLATSSPPLSIGPPPLPQSTLPPRFPSGRLNACSPAPGIQETIAEREQMALRPPIDPSRSLDLPLLHSPNTTLEDDGSDDASGAIAHILRGRCPNVASAHDSE